MRLGANSIAKSDAGCGDQTKFGDRGIQFGGRPRVIHMLWNGLVWVGTEPDAVALSTWLTAGESACSCVDPRAPECGLWTEIPCDHVIGSGSEAAENLGRNAQPAINATNTLSAAATTMADCHRWMRRSLRVLINARMYNTTLGRPMP